DAPLHKFKPVDRRNTNLRFQRVVDTDCPPLNTEHNACTRFRTRYLLNDKAVTTAIFVVDPGKAKLFSALGSFHRLLHTHGFGIISRANNAFYFLTTQVGRVIRAHADHFDFKVLRHGAERIAKQSQRLWYGIVETKECKSRGIRFTRRESLLRPE